MSGKPKVKSLDKKVEKLINAMNVEDTYRGVITYVINKSCPTSKEVIGKVIDIILTPKNMSQIKELTKKSYLEHYTPKEIEAMLKFYCSKEGKNIMLKASQLSTKLADSLKVITDKMMRESEKEVNAVIDEYIGKEADRKIQEDQKLMDGVFYDGVKNATLARYNFSKKYIEDKGWDVNALTADQIMEIRNQDGWKNAGFISQ